MTDRQAVVAGQFYPGTKTSLEKNLSELFSKAKKNTTAKLSAIISPHAGYTYSGEVAASAFNQMDENAVYDNIFVIASSHRVHFNGASIYAQGNYLTPLGKVNVNKLLAQELIDNHKCFSFYEGAHAEEHSLEVQLPFLQYKLKNKHNIVPIVIGSQDAAVSKEIAEALKPYFNENNLFVISTDFSHYPAYNDAVEADNQTAEAIVSNQPQTLIDTLNDYKSKFIPNLATNLCGWTSVLTLMYLTKDQKEYTYKKIDYRNSGDAYFGDKNQVVGYFAITVEKTND